MTPWAVTYADPEPNGLASMMGGLIEANLTGLLRMTRALLLHQLHSLLAAGGADDHHARCPSQLNGGGADAPTGTMH